MVQFLGNPRITPMQYIASLASILVFLFIGTNIFAELSDGWKTVIYVMFTGFSVLAGFNYNAVKAIAEIRKIWKNKELSWWEKMQMTGNIVMHGLKVMNEEFMQINKAQGTDPKESTIMTNQGSNYIDSSLYTDTT